jgi:hypothetical protein
MLMYPESFIQEQFIVTVAVERIVWTTGVLFNTIAALFAGLLQVY